MLQGCRQAAIKARSLSFETTSIFDIDPTEDKQKKQKRTNIMKDENGNLKIYEEKVGKKYLNVKYK